MPMWRASSRATCRCPACGAGEEPAAACPAAVLGARAATLAEEVVRDRGAQEEDPRRRVFERAIVSSKRSYSAAATLDRVRIGVARTTRSMP
jgi:hypothetical protein